ncbi:SusC/RagA family TonB-linked outer membrane protein [uncultured Prevotella sp.]|uniref:SusC/RagA family TonB-linked outer membrane protein n=1 Tax=uncultured Prevotella sp. TaxID=159272 RepID=UPI002625C4D5|nr:SusC/RagA family TonB-linked outer membrane protein [uncultured Prevotella sp.]
MRKKYQQFHSATMNAFKIAFVMLFLLSNCAIVMAQSPNKKISVTCKNEPLASALKKVEKASGYKVLFTYDEVQNYKVTISAKGREVSHVLKTIFDKLPFDYKFKGKYINVSKRERRILNISDGPEKGDHIVRGVVFDVHGSPIPGVLITVVGKHRGTTTNVEGVFGLDLQAPKALVEFSFIGMKKKRVTLTSQSAYVKVTLEDESHELGETVITGYRNVNKNSYTGSSTQILGDDLRKVSQTNILDAIQSFDPSFRIMDNAQFGSDPNAMPEMTIRGQSGVGNRALDTDQLSKSNLKNNPNLPTFIMDGFEVSIEKIYDLDPTRIESITILKDAAATAIYGSRAANGVVVVTTVAQKPGEVRVSYGFTGTLETPDLRDYNLANAAEKIEIERRAGLFEKGQPGINTEAQGVNAYNQKLALLKRGIDTDWLSIPLRNGFDQKHSVYIEGGTQNLRYGIDGSFNKVQGVMKDSGRDRYGVGISLDYRLKKFQVKNTTTFNHMKSKESPYGSFSDYTCLMPYDTPYDNGVLTKSLGFSQNGGRYLNNPLYEATLGNYNWNSYDEFINNLSFNWYINDYLMAKGQFSVSRQYSRSERFIDPLSSKTSVTADSSSQKDKMGDLYTTSSNNLTLSGNAFLFYNQSFDKHNINASAGWEINTSSNDGLSAHYRGFPSGQFHSPNYASEIYNKPTKSEGTSRMVSMLATANYTWNNIYLLDLSVRFDGSSEFGSNQRWAPFFSTGAGINIHNYKFLKGNQYINKLKLRGSYGRTGKVNFPDYAAQTMYQPLFDEWYATGYGAVLKALGNKDLTWEKTDKYDFGIETQFFNERLTIDFDYYYEKTIDLVNDVSLSTTSGFSTYKNNMGEIENKGFEITARYDIYKKKDWLVALWGNMAHNTNKILKISDSQRAYNQRVAEYYKKEQLNQEQIGSSLMEGNYSVPIAQYEEGQSLTSIWAVKSLGIDPATGKELFLNRDGTVTDKWDAAQEVVCGNTQPDFNGAFGFNVSYKQWSLFASFLYEWGGQQYNQTLVDRVENAKIEYGNVDLRVLTDRWQKPGDIAQFKNIKDGSLTTLPTSRFVQNNSFLRLNALTLTYDFNREWLKRNLGLRMLRLEASTSDLINWNSVRQERGLSYPKSYKFNFSVKAQF